MFKFQDDYKTELCNLKKQLMETEEIQNKSDSQINILLTNIRILQDERNSLELKLSQKQSGYDMQVCFIFRSNVCFVAYKNILVGCFATKNGGMQSVM